MSLPCVTSLCGEPCHVSPFTADSCVECFVAANTAVEFFFPVLCGQVFSLFLDSKSRTCRSSGS